MSQRLKFSSVLFFLLCTNTLLSQKESTGYQSQVGFGLLAPVAMINNTVTQENLIHDAPVKIYLITPLSVRSAVRIELNYAGFRPGFSNDFSDYRVLDSLPQYERVIEQKSPTICTFRNDTEIRFSWESQVFNSFPYLRCGIGILVGKATGKYYNYEQHYYVNDNSTSSFTVIDEEHFYNLSDINVFKTGLFTHLSIFYPLSQHIHFNTDVHFNFYSNHYNQKSATNYDPDHTHASRYTIQEFRLFLHPCLAYVF